MSKDFEFVSDAEQAAAFLAWKHGEPVEFWSQLSHQWGPFTTNFNISFDLILRRKPQPKLRPWTMEEVPIGARVKDGKCDWIGTILSAGNVGFTVFVTSAWTVGYLAAGSYTYSTDGGKTWLPAGVVE